VHIIGLLLVTNRSLYFQPLFTISQNPIEKVEIENISQIYQRRFELRDIGLEIMCLSGKCFYFVFEDREQRNQIFSAVASHVGKDCVMNVNLEKITLQWQNSEISNFEYLMYLNSAGNRSFNDLS